MVGWLQKIWYGGREYRWLLPLSGLYWVLLVLRRALYRTGIFSRRRVAAPVVIVGNITVGGTGKTPVTIWLAQELARRGFHPGIVSRGYGGSQSSSSMRVDAASDPVLVGDEPVLMAKRTACAVVVDADRARGAAKLVNDGADVILADDGLQHYRLQRDYEICVVDGVRGLGNRQLLPAGPLRETMDRLRSIDQMLVNGALEEDTDVQTVIEQNAIRFDLQATEVCRLNGSLTRPIDRFAGKTVHAVAAIGNPGRFFDSLRAHGMQPIEHAFPDHAHLRPRDLDFGDEFDILMTEKDAVKVMQAMPDNVWYVPVDLSMDSALSAAWLEQMVSRLKNESRFS
ncbi:MAG: tetraacyldisaccharide 4'-kinase [Gammaproteobacteria bacterium]|nr:tetraacyldisaccharide 4'-kinase [Gammaproteobacteria bacterium]